MYATLRLHRRVIAVAGTVAAVAGGCQSPLAVERHRMREIRMERVSRWHAELEEHRPHHLDWLGDTTRQMEVWRAETLEDTTSYVERRIRDDLENLQKAAPVRRAWLRYLVEARPESIETAAIRMFY